MSGRYERVSTPRPPPSDKHSSRPSQRPRWSQYQSIFPKLTTALSSRQVNAQDDEDHVSNTHQATPSAIPSSSPPPSFHSRASSTAPRNRRVNDPALADAFDADDSEDEDHPDDRQRLVRRDSDVAPSGSSAQDTPVSTPSLAPARPSPSTGSANRVYGGGIENGGVFSNLTAKPERKAGPEKEEMPPVNTPYTIYCMTL